MNGVFFVEGKRGRLKKEREGGRDWRDRELPHQKHREERQKKKKIKNLR